MSGRKRSVAKRVRNDKPGFRRQHRRRTRTQLTDTTQSQKKQQSNVLTCHGRGALLHWKGALGGTDFGVFAPFLCPWFSRIWFLLASTKRINVVKVEPSAFPYPSLKKSPRRTAMACVELMVSPCIGALQHG